MSNNSAQALDIRFLPTALFTWFVSVLILLPIAALTAQLIQCSETVLAYVSSALSFMTALIAGARAMRVRKKSAVLTALVSGMCIIIAALTLGFIIAGNALQADGILSLVTFTLSGCLVGAVFFSGAAKKKTRNTAARPKFR